jgi:hypothetical protein
VYDQEDHVKRIVVKEQHHEMKKLTLGAMWVCALLSSALPFVTSVDVFVIMFLLIIEKLVEKFRP